MSYLNVEIKASAPELNSARDYFLSHDADFKGTDIQTDTYFNVSHGRLKLREGNIENNLIFYERPDQAGPKNSSFSLVKIEDAAGLKKALSSSIGVKVIVNKKREIYYIKNVKFHLDTIENLGSFIEIEAGNILADLSQQQLQDQCEFYMKELRINPVNLIEISYSDMLLKK